MTPHNLNERHTLLGLLQYAKELIGEINTAVGAEIFYYTEAAGYFRLYVLRPPEMREGGTTTDIRVQGGRVDIEDLCRLCLRLEEAKAKLTTA